MQIGKLAKQAGMTVTVRFYERRKLLPEPTRTESDTGNADHTN
jgi:DNA-binding transcriptional MerR regulator